MHSQIMITCSKKYVLPCRTLILVKKEERGEKQALLRLIGYATHTHKALKIRDFRHTGTVG